MDDGLITTAQAADLLGVRIPTIYSYVSRGLLRPADAARTRHEGSIFRHRDIIALMEARRRPRRGRFELTIETAVTDVEPAGVLLFRGCNAAELAPALPFEDVAEIVWGGSGDAAWPTPSPPPAMSPGAILRDRIVEAVMRTAITDSERNTLSPTHFRAAGRSAIRAAAASLTDRKDRALDGSTAQLVLRALTPGKRPEQVVAAIDTALGLLADHELATSTLAARAAASTGADPYAVMTAGVAALGGVRHGGASAAAYDLLTATPATESELQTPAAGFGHTIYRGADPRGTVLLDLVATLDEQVAMSADRLIVQVARLTGAAPNVDLGLAALSLACDLPRHTGEVIFSIARLAGFIAHGIEEQGHPLRFRARASYTGASARSTAGPT